MKRYCIEQFRGLSKESFVGKGTEFYQRIEDYLRACVEENKIPKISVDSPEWKKYHFSYAEKQALLEASEKSPERYEIKLSSLQIKNQSEREKFIIRVMNWEIENTFANLIGIPSVCCDVVNEMYLAYCKVEGGKTKLSDRLSVEDKVIVSDNIKNDVKRNVVFPFDQKVKGLGTELEVLGADIIRLWFKSKNFKSLLKNVQGKSQKYNLMNYMSCGLDWVEATVDNYLILNKLVGGNIIFTFMQWVYPITKDLDREGTENLLKMLSTLMKCDSNCVCCEILRMIGKELYCIKEKGRYISKRLVLYDVYLKEAIDKFNIQYRGLCRLIADGVKETFDFEEWGQWVNEYKLFHLEQDLTNFSYQNMSEYIQEIKEIWDERLEFNEQVNSVIRIVVETGVNRYCVE